ncbi:hypothetical protein ZWY2020_033938 [Hordeum vulgare]|nr:hypothetical protein ZWY2020_033938 [Hordeum vulgare]
METTGEKPGSEEEEVGRMVFPAAGGLRGLVRNVHVMVRSVLEGYRRDLRTCLRLSRWGRLQDFSPCQRSSPSDADGKDGTGDGSQLWVRLQEPPGVHPFHPKYTRFEAQVLALRADPPRSPEAWGCRGSSAGGRRHSAVEERKDEIEASSGESGLESFVERLVPSVATHDMFWCRVFLAAVDKLRQAGCHFQACVSRAMSRGRRGKNSAGRLMMAKMIIKVITNKGTVTIPREERGAN